MLTTAMTSANGTIPNNICGQWQVDDSPILLLYLSFKGGKGRIPSAKAYRETLNLYRWAKEGGKTVIPPSNFTVVNWLRITGLVLQHVLLYLADYSGDLITSTDTDAELTDENALSSLRVLLEIAKNNETFLEDLKEQFLSKVTDDIANGLIKFLAGAEFGEFLSGILGGREHG